MKAGLILLSTLLAIGCLYSAAYEIHYCTDDWYCQPNITMLIFGIAAAICGIFYAMIEVK